MSVVFDNLDAYVEGMTTTIALTLLSFAAAFTIGMVVAAWRVSPIRPLQWAGGLYVGLVRNTPLAVLFVVFYFGFPKIGFRYSEFVSAVIVLAAYTGTFVAETIRAGINTVAQGQAEAARALGLSFTQVLTIVILPQALRTVVAPIGSVFSALIRNSSVAYTISVVELTGTADRLNTESARPLQVFLGAAVAYMLLTLPTGLAFGALERRVAIKR